MSRPVERIDYFLTNVNWEDLLKNIWGLEGYDLEIIVNNLEVIKESWKQYPDWRISQVLINNNLLPNYPGAWYYLEDWEILLKQGKDPRDFLFWGTYGKSGDKFQWILPKDMETGHIENIIKDVKEGKMRVHSEFLKTFIKELELRKINN